MKKAMKILLFILVVILILIVVAKRIGEFHGGLFPCKTGLNPCDIGLF